MRAKALRSTGNSPPAAAFLLNRSLFSAMVATKGAIMSGEVLVTDPPQGGLVVSRLCWRFLQCIWEIVPDDGSFTWLNVPALSLRFSNRIRTKKPVTYPQVCEWVTELVQAGVLIKHPTASGMYKRGVTDVTAVQHVRRVHGPGTYLEVLQRLGGAEPVMDPGLLLSVPYARLAAAIWQATAVEPVRLRVSVLRLRYLDIPDFYAAYAALWQAGVIVVSRTNHVRRGPTRVVRLADARLLGGYCTLDLERMAAHMPRVRVR